MVRTRLREEGRGETGQGRAGEQSEVVGTGKRTEMYTNIPSISKSGCRGLGVPSRDPLPLGGYVNTCVNSTLVPCAAG